MSSSLFLDTKHRHTAGWAAAKVLLRWESQDLAGIWQHLEAFQVECVGLGL